MKAIIYIGLLFLTIGWNNKQTEDDISLKLIPRSKTESNLVSFLYEIKNESEKEVVLMTASYGNGTYFKLEIFDSTLKKVDFPCLKFKIDYSEVFKKRTNYQKIYPAHKVKKRLTLKGCPDLDKPHLFELELPKGRYFAVLKYQFRHPEVGVDGGNAFFEKLWIGEVISDSTKFEVK